MSTLEHLEAECKAAKEETAIVKAQLLQLMAVHQSLKAQATEPQNTAVQQVNPEAGQPLKEGLTRTCGLCNAGLPKSAFSNAQWKRERDSPKCRACARSSLDLSDKKADLIQNASRAASGHRVRPNNFGFCTYVDEVFHLNCFGQLAALGAFASAKDVSESMAALLAVKRHANLADADAATTVCLCVGDGTTPKTAILAAYSTRWKSVVSIDPLLREEWVGHEPRGVRGLQGFSGTLDEYMATELEASSWSRVVVLLVHCHARLIEASSLKEIRARFGGAAASVVALPCCPNVRPERDLGKPTLSYEDDCVFSACRRVQVWNCDEAMARRTEIAPPPQADSVAPAPRRFIELSVGRTAVLQSQA